MSNFLDNGTVLPYGLLSDDAEAFMAGFNKSYRNTSLRIGIVVRSYIITDPNNLFKLTTEYDVLVFEQNEDKGSSIVTYRNCMASEGMGSIADYFEKELRVRTVALSPNNLINTTEQDGAVVLILCLDGMSDKALIVGAVTHPDRQTNLVSTLPYLEGEYNGVNITVNTDGSTSLIFKGATDNYGVPTDPSQGNTEVQIQTDGSFQVSHSAITFTLARSGTVTLTANEDINVTAQGNISFTIQGDANINVGGDCTATITGKFIQDAEEIDLNGNISGITTKNSHLGVIDLITGYPVNESKTVKGDV
jgi:hypothetical protein